MVILLSKITPELIGNAGGEPVSGLSHRLLHQILNHRYKNSEKISAHKFIHRRLLKK